MIMMVTQHVPSSARPTNSICCNPGSTIDDRLDLYDRSREVLVTQLEHPNF